MSGLCIFNAPLQKGVPFFMFKGYEALINQSLVTNAVVL